MSTLVLFSGPPGVGKSTLSYKLTQELGWGIITKDQVEASLKKNSIDNDWAAYDLMIDLAKLNLRNGASVILDAVFGYNKLRKQLIDIAEETHSIFKGIDCTCSDINLWQEHVKSRKVMVDGWTPVGWDKVEIVRNYYQKWEYPHVTIDAVNPLEENYKKILKYVKE